MKRRRVPHVIKRKVNGKDVRVRLSDGYINMEDWVAALGQSPETFERYLASPEGKAFLVKLSAKTGKPVSQLVQRVGPSWERGI